MAKRRKAQTLQQAAPNIAKEWHPTKNGTLTPENVQAWSRERVWWRCNKNPAHEWQMTVGYRSRIPSPCPQCSGGRKQKYVQTLVGAHPDIAAEWHPSFNRTATPSGKATRHSYASAWWRCSQGHVWNDTIYNRTRLHKSCPTCAQAKARKERRR